MDEDKKVDIAKIKRTVATATREPERYCLKIKYTDRFGDDSERVINVIRLIGQDRVLALCLSREEPRMFSIGKMSEAELVETSDVLMPEPIRDRISEARNSSLRSASRQMVGRKGARQEQQPGEADGEAAGGGG